MNDKLRESLARFRVLSNSLRTNLHDARIWHPENFNLDGVDELIRQWDESVKPVVELEALLAEQAPAGEFDARAFNDDIVLLDDELSMAEHEHASFERRAELIEKAFSRVYAAGRAVKP